MALLSTGCLLLILSILCWTRGRAIDHLLTELGAKDAQILDLTASLEAQGRQVTELSRLAAERKAEVERALAQAGTFRGIIERRAQEILVRPPVGATSCEAAENLIDAYRAGGQL